MKLIAKTWRSIGFIKILVGEAWFTRFRFDHAHVRCQCKTHQREKEYIAGTENHRVVRGESFVHKNVVAKNVEPQNDRYCQKPRPNAFVQPGMNDNIRAIGKQHSGGDQVHIKTLRKNSRLTWNRKQNEKNVAENQRVFYQEICFACLLYTSDAADE